MYERRSVKETERTYTRADVSRAVNAGADLVLEDFDASEQDRDLVNIIVNAALTLLDKPDATLAEVIEENYGDEDPDEVRSWWTG